MLLRSELSVHQSRKRFPFAVQMSVTSLLFTFLVALPTAFSGIYYFLIASDRYMAQADFTVRTVNGSQSGGLSSLLSTFGITRAEDQSYAVVDYLTSRDAVKAIDSEHSLRSLFNKPGVDWFARYPFWWQFYMGDSFEALYDYYYSRVEAWYSSRGGINTLTVIAFSPEDAKLIAELLLRQSEILINKMNERANSDQISFAKKEVERAEAMVVAAQQKITNYRNTELIMDPVADSTRVLDLIATLTSELADTQRQLTETLQGSPSNPAVQSLKARITALKEQLETERAKIVGHDSSLASKIATYERLALDRQFADRNLSNAFDGLQFAQQIAWGQLLYIETIVQPSLSDYPTEPQSTKNTAEVFFIGFVLFALVWLVVSAAKEHAE